MARRKTQPVNKDNKYLNIEEKNNQKALASKHISVSFFVFLLIFAYLVFVVISFSVKEKVAFTIAEPGVVLSSNVFEGVVLKNETVVKSLDKGNTKYFVAEGSKVKVDQMICAVDKDGAMSAIFAESLNEIARVLEQDDEAVMLNYRYLKNDIKNYVMNSKASNFSYTYALKRDINKALGEITNTVMLSQDPRMEKVYAELNVLEAGRNEKIDVFHAPLSGLVSYKFDGLEDITIENFTIADLKKKVTYNDGLKQEEVKAEQNLFKIIDNYLWYIASEIDLVGYEHLKKLYDQNRRYINLYFPDKEITIDVFVKELYLEGENAYVVFTIDRYLNDFLNDRFLNYRIIYNQYEGIKLPNSAVITQKFAQIPLKALTRSGNAFGISKSVFSEENAENEKIVFFRVPYYRTDTEYAYIPLTKDIQLGEHISYYDEATKAAINFQLIETKEIEGVYEVNKGFASFKIIDTQQIEGAYRIVASNTPYGVRPYDRIATSGNLVKEAQIIN